MKTEKPPLGLVPEKLFKEKINKQRFLDVCGAISRYYTAGLKINVEWIEEYNQLVEEIEIQKENPHHDSPWLYNLPHESDVDMVFRLFQRVTSSSIEATIELLEKENIYLIESQRSTSTYDESTFFENQKRIKSLSILLAKSKRYFKSQI